MAPFPIQAGLYRIVYSASRRNIKRISRNGKERIWICTVTRVCFFAALFVQVPACDRQQRIFKEVIPMNDSRTARQAPLFSCTYARTGYIGVLTIGGDLAPDRLQEINRRLIDSMVDADFVVVNLDRVTSIASDCFTLFCMASHSAYSLNKRLHLGQATPELYIAASRICSSNFIKTGHHDCTTHCFWLDQTAEDGMNANMDLRGY